MSSDSGAQRMPDARQVSGDDGDLSRELARHYSRFRVAERILLTGHSHQAWPDVAFEAQQRAWLDAAELVDDKWARAEEVADDVRAGWRRLLNDPDGEIALGQNTHELIVRWLSAILPVSFGGAGAGAGDDRSVPPRLITTDGEFHTIRRQLDRLAEVGADVVKIAARPVDTLAERLIAALDAGRGSVLVSSVLFETAEIVPGLERLAAACNEAGVPLLVDAYHHVNVVPFDIAALGLARAFVVGGGYKYCQLGEGNCFLRVPPGIELTPVITGWFSEFDALANAPTPGAVPFGRGATRLAGATYDPTSHYRAAAVFRFHTDLGLTPTLLRAVSRRQTALFCEKLRAQDLDPRHAAIVDVPPERRAGFVAVRSPFAARLAHTLRRDGVFVDARGEMLRVGPAPYVSDIQLADAAALVAEHVRRIAHAT